MPRASQPTVLPHPPRAPPSLAVDGPALSGDHREELCLTMCQLRGRGSHARSGGTPASQQRMRSFPAPNESAQGLVGCLFVTVATPQTYRGLF